MHLTIFRTVIYYIVVYRIINTISHKLQMYDNHKMFEILALHAIADNTDSICTG